MQYKIRRVNPPGRDALEHGLFGNKGGAQKGSTWDNHLYIARQKVGDGWRYFYTQAELRAAQAKQAGGQLKRNATAAVKSGVASAKRAVRNAPDNIRSGISSAKNTIRTTASSARTSASNALNSARTVAGKAKNVLSGQYAKDVDNQKLTYKISDGINRTLSSVKDASDKGKDFLDRVTKPVADKAQTAVDKAREAATKAADKAQAAADKATKAAEKAREIANKALDNAKNASSDAVNRAKDIGGKAADRIEETAKDVQRYGNNVANRAQEGLWEARRNVEEFADKAKNFATNKAYRNDKTYREMVNGVSSMKQDLKSVNAYIDELMDNGTTTSEARQELRDNIELRRQIEDSLDYVQNEIDDYEKRNK